MCDERQKSWPQAAVHWVRFRFDIGYRVRIEIEQYHRTGWEGLAKTMADWDLWGLRSEKEAKPCSGSSDLFDEVVQQLQDDL